MLYKDIIIKNKLYMEIETKRREFRVLLCCWCCGGLGRNRKLREGKEVLCSFPMPCPVHLFHLAVSELYPFILNPWSSEQNVSLSSVSCSSKLVNPKKGWWEPMIYSQWIRRTGNNLDLQLVSEIQRVGGWNLQCKMGWSEAQAII